MASPEEKRIQSIQLRVMNVIRAAALDLQSHQLIGNLVQNVFRSAVLQRLSIVFRSAHFESMLPVICHRLNRQQSLAASPARTSRADARQRKSRVRKAGRE